MLNVQQKNNFLILKEIEIHCLRYKLIGNNS